MRLLLTNTGDRDGDDVTQVFVRDRVASLAQPVRRLVAFTRTGLPAGATAELVFPLGAQQLGFWDNEAQFIIEPGEFEVYVGGGLDGTRSMVLTVTA